ncbi:flavin reductase family protein [Enterovirga rhinocerotis]|uniref:Flavin reductase (DIM6/NTAB) family NADH-FMN oxidoreductase RutF n=1 Tax=Enterovirga rhinocerotis TaxID=1339210 RepID=A0A4R7BWW8_9HYPH|nr:flavin reductase family protein [Enterovirga rhinocerotis]TDR90384.1 flavin reductase (DIM6/NTAB) family NADH-FMN oxidoreductase RutF [Enterovirga rhinocerotis]
MSEAAFRQALGEFATGVAVVTARGKDGDDVGMTMSSFNSVSLDPPLVLFSVSRSARSLPAMLEAGGYAVNVLARDQEGIAQRFARTLGDKWERVRTSLGHAEAPLIAGALAHFECEPYAHHDGGDHVIFVARVLRHSVHPGPKEPLLFFRRRYRGLDEARDEDAPDNPSPIL